MKKGDTIRYIKTGQVGRVIGVKTPKEMLAKKLKNEEEMANTRFLRRSPALQQINSLINPIWTLVEPKNSVIESCVGEIVSGDEECFVITRQLLIEKTLKQ